MPVKGLLKIISILLFIQVMNPVMAGNDSWKRLPLLEGRYYINVPANAGIKERGHNIMEPAHSAEAETRIICDDKKERFVIFTSELYKYSDKNIMNEFNAFYNAEEKKYKFESYLSKKKNRIILGWPVDEKYDDETFLLLDTFIEGNDNILIQIGFYVNEAAYRNNRKKYIKLSKTIIDTIEQGEKKLTLNKRTYSFLTITYPKNRKKIEIPIPENYVLKKNLGPDFTVYRLFELTPFSSDVSPGISIYQGFDASYVHLDYGFKTKEAVKIPSTFLNEDIKWLVFEKKKDDKTEFILSEVIFGVYDDYYTEALHIFIYSDSYDRMKKQHDIIKAMTIK